ncbi:MAG: XdhC family protein, partial [Candidatus Cloacimonetes bacterium]|nr:XdhC family protein [Candidatus Cloacimonadota bacterium]
KEFINEKLYPQVDERIFADYSKYSKHFEPARNSYFIILTCDCKYNYEILKNIYQRELNAKYVCMLGSKVEATASLKKLKSKIGKVDLENLYFQVGLGIGGDTPSEIALMIAAEMQMVEYGKDK